MLRLLLGCTIFGLVIAACAPEQPAVCKPTVRRVDNLINQSSLVIGNFAPDNHNYDYFHIQDGSFGGVTESSNVEIIFEEPENSPSFTVHVSETEHQRRIEATFRRDAFTRTPTGWFSAEAAQPYLFEQPPTATANGWHSSATYTTTIAITNEFTDAPSSFSMSGTGAVQFAFTARRQEPVTTYTIPCAE